MKTFATLSGHVLLDLGPRLKVETRVVELPNGRVVADWPWLVTRDYVIVVARAKDGRFMLFRQPKYGVEGLSLAPVGGYIEDHELPPDAARRELLEEMGCRAERLNLLGSFRVDGNHGAGTAHLFLAEGTAKVREPHSDDVEDQEPVVLGARELRAALLSGEFKVLAWSTAVALALLEIGSA